MAYQSVTFTWGCNTMIDYLVSRHAVYRNWKIDVQMTFQRYNNTPSDQQKVFDFQIWHM